MCAAKVIYFPAERMAHLAGIGDLRCFTSRLDLRKQINNVKFIDVNEDLLQRNLSRLSQRNFVFATLFATKY